MTGRLESVCAAAAAIALACLVVPSLAPAAEIARYDARVRIAADGLARVTLVLDLGRVTPGTVLIPIGYRATTNLRVISPIGVTAAGDGSLIRLTVPPDAPESVRVTVAFDVAQALELTDPAPGERATLPPGMRHLRPAFMNSQPGAIGRFEFRVMFPDGLRAHALRDALPKLRKGEAGPRARLEVIDGQPGAVLFVDRIGQGEAASMFVELVPVSRSLGWLLAGLALAIAYLVGFRDLVRSPQAPEPPRS